ncbi:MAG: TetR/AcrR family transcriptional regulator [Nevskiales bacterium]
MARPRSEDKRKAILDAAVAVFAQRGVGAAPTSAISKAAGVAEGTLFTYFATKDVLVNELYRALKLEMADVLLSTFPRAADIRGKYQHFWNTYVYWGVANPDKRKVMAQLHVLENITEESRAIGYAPFAEVERMGVDSIRRKQIRDYPHPFIAAMLGAMAETTMVFIAQESRKRAYYCAAGFELFWKGISLE